MRVAGIILCAIGVLFFILGFVGLAMVGPAGASSLSGGIFWMVIGGYLIWRADKKKQEKAERDKWINGES